MTNVPQMTREALADVYKLFDVSYLMEGTDKDWEQYWGRGNKLIQQYGDSTPLLHLLEAYAGVIECAINERKTGNKSLTWGKDEDYPHPRKI